MRPIPDDVEPVPASAHESAKLADGGAVAQADASRFVELSHTDKAPACSDSRHRVLRVHQVAADRWIIARDVLGVLRSERKAQVSQQLDQNGAIVGMSVEDVGEDSCLGAIGFRTGDLVRTVNGLSLDYAAWSNVYQSIQKNGSAVVRLDRGGRTLTVLYEVRDD